MCLSRNYLIPDYFLGFLCVFVSLWFLILLATMSIRFLPPRVDVERRPDGTLVLRSPEPLRSYARCLGEYLERWAAEKPNDVFLAEREGENWKKITWAQTRQQVHSIATSLLSRGVSVEHPVAILSDNSIEHALIALAAMHIGVPVAPISPAYSLMSRDFAKLKKAVSLIQPALAFVDDAQQYARALAAIDDPNIEVVAARNIGAATPFARLTAQINPAIVSRAFAAVQPDTIAKFLFTSGSTGQPKAVINTQRMLCSNIQSATQTWPFLEDEPPVLVDWLPWNHTFGGNNNFSAVFAYGGTLYIDAGKPLPGLIEKTVRNLREVSPTMYYNVPRGYDALLPFLESDVALRRSFFARLKVLIYAAAALPEQLWERLEQLAIQETGKCVWMASAWGSTETAPMVTLVHFEPIRTSVIGLPTPGCELKMVPVGHAGRYELRVRGPNVTPGYWKQPDLTKAAFDEEGFYKMGDAGCFADEADPAQGIEFAGRLAEDFKLSSATWVHVGDLRVRALAALAPVAQDIVITGHDRKEVGFLIFPKPNVVDDPSIREQVRKGMALLRDEGRGSSMYATRAILLKDPPSIDAGEITDKGYINQRAVLDRRATLVESLYRDPPDSDVILLRD
jgi:feruloyl-CoA synthase